VLSEACFLAEHRPGAIRSILDFVARGAIRIAFRLDTEATAVSELMTRYGNIPMSLADACLVRMAELYEGSPVFTFDSDFRTYRMHGRRVIPTIMPGK
jgi:predicted nucleic acid-binding protein